MRRSSGTSPRCGQSAQRDRQRDVAAGDRGGARAGVGLQHVAVDRDRALPQPRQVGDARAATGRSAVGSPGCARRDVPGSPRGSMRSFVEAGSIEYSPVTQPFPVPLSHRGASSRDRGRARAPASCPWRTAPSPPPTPGSPAPKCTGRSWSGERPSGLVTIRSPAWALVRRSRRDRRTRPAASARETSGSSVGQDVGEHQALRAGPPRVLGGLHGAQVEEHLLGRLLVRGFRHEHVGVARELDDLLGRAGVAGVGEHCAARFDPIAHRVHADVRHLEHRDRERPHLEASPRPTGRNEYASRSTSLPSSDTNRLTESTNPSGE